jgi:carbamoyltransferase
MSYNILGINPFHNGSACVLSDGEVIYFLEEERLSKYKYDANPFRVILDVLDKFKINEVVIAGINTNDRVLGYSNEDPFYSLIRKFSPKILFTSYSDYHHDSHITHTYYNSGFNNALGIVIDAGGSEIFDSNGESLGLEVDSIYACSPKNITYLHKEFLLPSNTHPKLSTNVAMTYSAITCHSLHFNLNEDGKTMGLSSYGGPNSSIPPLFIGNKSNPNLIYEIKTHYRVPIVHNSLIFSKTNTKPLKYSQQEKDLAWRIQNDTQQIVGDYIEKYIKETGLKQVCCAGGYFLNCVANYYLKKRFPTIEFYFEPISHDGGTAIGDTYRRWKELNPNFKPKKQKTLYYGPKYSKEQLLEGIKKYV